MAIIKMLWCYSKKCRTLRPFYWDNDCFRCSVCGSKQLRNK